MWRPEKGTPRDRQPRLQPLRDDSCAPRTAQAAAKPKPAAKAGGGAALAPHNAGGGGGGAGKTIEETYQKLSQLEHILLRPDTYIGSTEKQQQQLWVHDGERMTLQNITFAPGLYKIFDEILVNAADNKVRDPSMDTVRVDIDVVRLRLARVLGVFGVLTQRC